MCICLCQTSNLEWHSLQTIFWQHGQKRLSPDFAATLCGQSTFSTWCLATFALWLKLVFPTYGQQESCLGQLRSYQEGTWLSETLQEYLSATWPMSGYVCFVTNLHLQAEGLCKDFPTRVSLPVCLENNVASCRQWFLLMKETGVVEWYHHCSKATQICYVSDKCHLSQKVFKHLVLKLWTETQHECCKVLVAF